MKCEICGAEIPEGSLYCEKCGKDVHLVPDFTEFAVNKAEETVKNLISEFDDDETDFGRSPEGANDERPVRKIDSSDEKPKNIIIPEEKPKQEEKKDEKNDNQQS